MIPQIARRLIKEYQPANTSLIFDPYMGSGTTLVEANLAKIDAIGTDLNPLARLMSKVKTTHYSVEAIREVFSEICNEIDNYSEDRVINKDFGHISNVLFWYSIDNLYKLSYLNQVVCKYEEHKEFFYIPISEIVREVSYTRNSEFKRYKMSEKQLLTFNPDPFVLFKNKVNRNILGLENFNNSSDAKYKSTICSFNTAEGIPNTILEKDSVDMIVTSPPYGDSRTTVAYGQFSRWANEWFKFENSKNLDKILMGGVQKNEELFVTKSISRELSEIKEKDSVRYKDVISFLNDYYLSIKNVSKVVRVGGVVCYVVGNRTVKGVQIPLDYFTAEMFEKCSFRHIETIVREIPNKRMPSKTSPTNEKGKKVGTMTNEYIVIMEKVVKE